MAILCSGGERVSVGRALLGRVGAGDRRAFFEAGRACDVTGGDKRCLTGRRAVNGRLQEARVTNFRVSVTTTRITKMADVKVQSLVCCNRGTNSDM